MMPEPFILDIGRDGIPHFASGFGAPARTVIDIKNTPMRRWIDVNATRRQITLDIDGRLWVYKCVGVGLHGEWICDHQP